MASAPTDNEPRGFRAAMLAAQDPQFRSDLARGLSNVANRGVAAILGAPVDTAALGLSAVGFKHPAPVGGSEWIGQKMESAGLVSPERNPVAETLAAVSMPGGLTRAARGLSALADMSPAIAPSSGGGMGFTAQFGAISPEGKARLLADLQAGKGSGTYRLGDVTEGQSRALSKLGMPPTTNRDVMMTDDALRHMHDKRVIQEGFSPAEVALFAEQAMAKRSRVDLDPGKSRQQPSLLNEGLRDPVTGKKYDARMPLRAQDGAFGARSAVPDGLPPRKK